MTQEVRLEDASSHHQGRLAKYPQSRHQVIVLSQMVSSPRPERARLDAAFRATACTFASRHPWGTWGVASRIGMRADACTRAPKAETRV